MKEQQTYPIVWRNNQAFCNNVLIGSFEYISHDGMDYWEWDSPFGIGQVRSLKDAKFFIEDAFRSFIRDVTKQGGDK